MSWPIFWLISKYSGLYKTGTDIAGTDTNMAVTDRNFAFIGINISIEQKYRLNDISLISLTYFRYKVWWDMVCRHVTC